MAYSLKKIKEIYAINYSTYYHFLSKIESNNIITLVPHSKKLQSCVVSTSRLKGPKELIEFMYFVS